MKYPKDLGPQSQTEAMAILFTMLGNAYNLLAQYEADERKEEHERRFEALKPVCKDCNMPMGNEHLPGCKLGSGKIK